MVDKLPSAGISTPLWVMVALQVWTWYRSGRAESTAPALSAPCSCAHEIEPLEVKLDHAAESQAELRFQLKLTVGIDIFIAVCLLGLACCGTSRCRQRARRREAPSTLVEDSEDEGGGLHLESSPAKRGLRTPSSRK